MSGDRFGEIPGMPSGSERVACDEKGVRNLGDPFASHRLGRVCRPQEGDPTGLGESDRSIVLCDGRADHTASRSGSPRGRERRDCVACTDGDVRLREAELYIAPILQGISNRAHSHKQHRFGGLYRLLNEQSLRWAFHHLNRRAAPGVDGVTWDAYARDLDANLADLAARLHGKRYRAQLVRRHYVPKPSGKLRGLGIPALEDKLVQYAVAKLLESIWEADFLCWSFGYRPGIGAKDAVYELTKQIQFGSFRWGVEADIAGFFDNLDHAWLLRMLDERIADRALLDLIRRWLKAGVLEEATTVVHPGAGTPQGGVISPILANIYLHYVLDLFFEKRVKRRCRGKALLVRYADDFVCLFQYHDDARRFYEFLPQRLGDFGLAVAPEKTRMLKFTRFECGERNGVFSFLGFEFRWGLGRGGKPYVWTRTARTRFRRAIRSFRDWIRGSRNVKLGVIFATVCRKYQGHFNYFGVVGNQDSLWRFWKACQRLLFKWLNRRSQRRSYNWAGFFELCEHFGVPVPTVHKRPPKRRLGFV
jgi:RNA-directed DNA polymerase